MPKPNPRTAADILEEAAETYREKNAQYGDSYLKHGVITSTLFGGKAVLATADDFNRYAIVDLIVVKLIRYCNNFYTGHQDSIRDLIVYGSMLEELDERARNRDGNRAREENSRLVGGER